MAFTMAPTVEWMPYTAQLNNFGIAWGMYWMWVHLRVHEWIAIILVVFIEVGWQMVQAFVPTAADGIGLYLGGDGFNYANLIYATGGMTLAFLIDLMQPPSVRPLGGYKKCEKLEPGTPDYEKCLMNLEEMELEELEEFE